MCRLRQIKFAANLATLSHVTITAAYETPSTAAPGKGCVRLSFLHGRFVCRPLRIIVTALLLLPLAHGRLVALEAGEETLV